MSEQRVLPVDLTGTGNPSQDLVIPLTITEESAFKTGVALKLIQFAVDLAGFRGFRIERVEPEAAKKPPSMPGGI